MTELLHPTPPFDLAQSADALALLEGVDPGPRRRTIYRSWMDEGTPVVVRIAETGTLRDPELEFDVLAGHALGWERIAHALTRMLSLNFDRATLRARAAGDDAFTALLDATEGYHPVLAPTPFEAAVWAILTQGQYRSIAKSTWEKLIDGIGARPEIDGRTLSCFPDPATVLARQAELATLVRRESHRLYILAAAELFTTDLAEGAIVQFQPEDVVDLLTQTPGFGPYTTVFTCSRGLGLFSVPPINDAVFARVLAARYGDLRAQDRRELLDQYGPLVGAWFHMLRVFEQIPRP